MTLRDAGIAIVRAAPWLDTLARGVYQHVPQAFHDNPTTRLKSLFAAADKIVFLQIGAFDGVSGDPIAPLIRADPRWSGILVEPQPEVFERLVRNCRGFEDRLKPVRCAISNTSGEATIYSVSAEEMKRRGFDAWAGEVASFDRQHVLKHFSEVSVTETQVAVLTVDALAEQNGLTEIDVIVMDVEGHERPIIDSIDWDRWRVRACVYEHKHLGPEDAQHLRQLLQSQGFLLKEFGRDTVAHRSL